MFNISTLPTDSLYKFCFTFGLLLLAFSMYFRINQLDRFDKKQLYFLVDSLSKLDIKFSQRENNLVKDFNGLIVAAKDSDAMRYNAQRVYNYLDVLIKGHWIDSSDYDSTAVYQYVIFKRPAAYYPIYVRDKFINRHKKLHSLRMDEIELLKGKLSENNYIFYAMFVLSSILFVIGTLGWYIRIQIPQDEILRMQLKQLKQGIIDSNKLYVLGRKHIDPINVKQKRS